MIAILYRLSVLSKFCFLQFTFFLTIFNRSTVTNIWLLYAVFSYLKFTLKSKDTIAIFYREKITLSLSEQNKCSNCFHFSGYLPIALKEKMDSFWPKKLSQGELKFDPGFRVIGEYMSKIDSILRVNLTNWNSPGIPSIWRIFESGWLNIERQFDKLTRNIASIWVKYSPITRNPESNRSSTCDSTF